MTQSEMSRSHRQYREYYKILEEDFCATERYLYIDPDNFSGFSSEFIKLLQTICSEIDITLRFLCNLLDPCFKGNTFPEYCKCVLDKNPFFPRANVTIRKVDSLMLAPWLGWEYHQKTTKRGNVHIDATNPEWWTMYNKVKHDRIAIRPETNKPYYKYANQKNVLDALAALFIVDSYSFHLLYERTPNEQKDTHFLQEWYESGKLFSGFVIAGGFE